MDLYCLKDRLIWCQQGKETWRKQKALPFYVLDSEQVGECSLFMLSKNTLARLKGTTLLPVPTACTAPCTHTPLSHSGQTHPGTAFSFLIHTAPVLTAHCNPALWNKSSMTKIFTRVLLHIWEKQGVSAGEQNIKILVNEKGKSWTKKWDRWQVCPWTDRN